MPPANEPALTPCGDCNTIMHAKMYALGSKYGIKSLKDVALGKFKEAAMYAWNHGDFVEAIGIVYSTTPDGDKGLRDIVTRVLLDHSQVISGKQAVEACIRGIDGLAYDLWKASSANANMATSGPSCAVCGTARAHSCYSCGATYLVCNCPAYSHCERCGSYQG